MSGGADSLALCHSLADLRQELGFELAACHVEHGLREEARADAEAIQAFCNSLGLTLIRMSRDARREAAARGVSLEEAGRELRYEALAEAAHSAGFGVIATAHHADDQAETILMHLFRGCAPGGLAGMAGRRTLPGDPPLLLIRPLLDVRKDELLRYCRAHGVQPRPDWTNLELRYRRNRLRHLVLPLVESAYPGSVPAILRLGRLASEDDRLLVEMASDLLRQARLDDPGASRLACLPWLSGVAPRLRLSRRRLAEAPPPLARRALALALDELSGSGTPGNRDLELLLALAADGPAPGFTLPGGDVECRRSGSAITLQRLPASREALADQVLPVPGEVHLTDPACRMQIGVEAVGSLCCPPPEAVLLPAAVRGDLVLRSPRPQDRLRPLGSPGEKLLSDLFQQYAVPLQARRSWPIIADAEGIAWVCGLAVAERFRVPSAGLRVIRMRWCTESEPDA